MPDVVSIAGCSAVTSSVNAVLNRTHKVLSRAGLQVETVSIRHLPAEDLILGRTQHASIQQSRQLIQQATGIIIATTVHQFGYSGGLKAFLDILPGGAFRGKPVLLLAMAPSPAQFHSFDGALRLVLRDALGAQEILDTVYLPQNLVHLHNRQVWLDDFLSERLDSAVQRFKNRLFPGIFSQPLNQLGAVV
ncbi:MAG: NAD(P)H-dependent oxidoreductase [Caldilineaceae bacterium]|nr:NAD(P)H-dependent oxidoreductase [Caldilineaceae bacterium]